MRKRITAIVVGATSCGAAALTGQNPVPEPVNHSYIAFTIPEKDLLPENVAHDPVSGAFFVGSTRHGKILRWAFGHSVEDFTDRDAAGLWMVIGMKVDAERRHLWAASSGGQNLVGFGDGPGRPAGVFEFAVDSGRLLDRWTLVDGTHFFNDLVVAADGDVYVTHMFDSAAVYRISGGTGELEVLTTLDGRSFPNGIALDEVGGHLYVAHSEGVSRVARDGSRIEDVPPLRACTSPRS